MLPVKKLLAILFILLSLSGYSQVTRHHGVFWGRLILSDKISNKWRWELYLQKRTQNVPGEKSIFGAPHFNSLWLWFNYSINKNFRLALSPFGYFNSYAFLTEPGDVDIPGVKEFRFVARADHEQKSRFLNYGNRYTVEYRRRDLNHNDVYQPNWRIRYQARLERPLKKILPNNNALSVFISDEILVQFGKAVRANSNVFDQNRFSAGFSLPLLKNVKGSFSYLNILQKRNTSNDFDDAHALWVVLTLENLFSQMGK